MGVRQPNSLERAAEMLAKADSLRQQADELTVAVACALPTLRADLSVSQSFLAAEMGSTQAYVSQIERGHVSTPTSVTRAVSALADASGRGDARTDLARLRGKE